MHNRYHTTTNNNDDDYKSSKTKTTAIKEGKKLQPQLPYNPDRWQLANHAPISWLLGLHCHIGWEIIYRAVTHTAINTSRQRDSILTPLSPPRTLWPSDRRTFTLQTPTTKINKPVGSSNAAFGRWRHILHKGTQLTGNQHARTHPGQESHGMRVSYKVHKDSTTVTSMISCLMDSAVGSIRVKLIRKKERSFSGGENERERRWGSVGWWWWWCLHSKP